MGTYLTQEHDNAPAVVSRIRLQPNERIVAAALQSKWWTLPLYVVTLWIWAFWRKRHAYVLTNQRLVTLAGIIAKSQRSVGLERIQDVNVHTSPISGGGSVVLSTAGGDLSIRALTRLTQKDARDFADMIQTAMRERRPPSDGL